MLFGSGSRNVVLDKSGNIYGGERGVWVLNNVNGGVTEGATPGNTGSGAPANHPTNGTEVTSSDATAAADAADTPFLALHWVIKAVA